MDLDEFEEASSDREEEVEPSVQNSATFPTLLLKSSKKVIFFNAEM